MSGSKVLLLVPLLLAPSPMFGSQISGAADLIGTMFVVSGTDAGQSGRQLQGMVGTATFLGGGTATCTFDGTGLCSSANLFSVLVTPDTSQTSSADWIISNLNTVAVISVTLNGTYATASSSPLQLVAFNPALQGGHPWYNGVGSGSTSCGATTGLTVCREATSSPGGTTAAAASVTYFNSIRVSGQSYNNDLWGGITLTFNTNPFNPGEDFQFKIDTDGFTSAAIEVPVPEPASVGFAGLALVMLGARKYFHKKS
jgi:hypothetical protein